jgi:hypothetical protein
MCIYIRKILAHYCAKHFGRIEAAYRPGLPKGSVEPQVRA